MSSLSRGPVEDAEFVQDTVRRSMPDLKRPRLRTSSEAKFAEVEQKSAECYASIETLTRQFEELAAGMDEDAVPRAVEGGEAGEPAWEDTSMVHHVEDLRQAAKKDP